MGEGLIRENDLYEAHSLFTYLMWEIIIIDKNSNEIIDSIFPQNRYEEEVFLNKYF